MDARRVRKAVSWLATAAALAGCRSAAEGYAGGDVAEVAADVARRADTGEAPPAYGADDGTLDAACAALLAKPLTQEAAVKVALLNNRTVRQSYERLGVARADLLQAGLVSNPVFTASVKSFSKGPEIELSLLQSFVELFFVPLRRCVAQADLLAAEASVARDLVHLVYDVRRAFVTLHAAHALAEAKRDALKTATTQRDLMKSLHEAGNVLDAQWTIAETSVARARLDLAAAEAMETDAREPIQVLLGLGDERVAWTTEETLRDPPLALPEQDEAVSRAVANSLDLAENRARIDAAAYSGGLRRREGVLPRLDLGPVGKRENDGPWGFGAEVSTAIPVFDQGQARVLESDARFRERMARHVALTVEVRSAARRFRERAAMFRDRAKALAEEYLPLRARLLRETVQQYNAMQIGAFEVLLERQEQAEAERERLEAVREAWIARLDLEELLAGSLDRERLDALHVPEAAQHPSVLGTASGGHPR